MSLSWKFRFGWMMLANGMGMARRNALNYDR
jgi:hypothetical protein